MKDNRQQITTIICLSRFFKLFSLSLFSNYFDFVLNYFEISCGIYQRKKLLKQFYADLNQIFIN